MAAIKIGISQGLPKVDQIQAFGTQLMPIPHLHQTCAGCTLEHCMSTMDNLSGNCCKRKRRMLSLPPGHWHGKLGNLSENNGRPPNTIGTSSNLPPRTAPTEWPTRPRSQPRTVKQHTSLMIVFTEDLNLYVVQEEISPLCIATGSQKEMKQKRIWEAKCFPTP